MQQAVPKQAVLVFLLPLKTGCNVAKRAEMGVEYWLEGVLRGGSPYLEMTRDSGLEASKREGIGSGWALGLQLVRFG